MTTVEMDSKKQEHKSAKKKQKSFRPTNIGTPQAPLRPRQIKQQEPELLSDWEHASWSWQALKLVKFYIFKSPSVNVISRNFHKRLLSLVQEPKP